ncbi:hypothetical protein [Desulfosarcina widdelii]|uniref:hypothetical protein n=1 Tax=Desulfosarcina widdelii TaxID=947919 RepID=UPI001E5E8F0B|nr:hypothetical protein [Desulfosarcina widdelii]
MIAPPQDVGSDRGLKASGAFTTGSVFPLKNSVNAVGFRCKAETNDSQWPALFESPFADALVFIGTNGIDGDLFRFRLFAGGNVHDRPDRAPGDKAGKKNNRRNPIKPPPPRGSQCEKHQAGDGADDSFCPADIAFHGLLLWFEKESISSTIEKAKQMPDKIVNIPLYSNLLANQETNFTDFGVNPFYNLANLSIEAAGDLRLITKFTK